MNKVTISNIALGILIVAAGIVLVAAPQTSIKIVIILLGAGAIVNGVFSLIKVRPLYDDSQFRLAAIVRSLVSIVVGLLACVLPLAFFNAANTVIRVMLYLFGVYLIFSAIAEFFLVYKLHEAEIPARMFAGEAVISILVAIILFMLPANFGITIIRILGIILVVCGIVHALYSYLNRSLVVEPDSVHDDDGEAE